MDLTSQRLIGAVVMIIAVLALVIAAVVQPVAEWSAWTFVVACLVLLLVLIGLLAIVSTSTTLLTGKRPQDRSSVWSTIALIAIGIALILMVVSGFVGGWTAAEVLQVGIFGSIEAMFAGTWLATRGSVEGPAPTSP